MKKILFAAAASALVFAAMPAAAGEWYAQVNVGATVQTEADVNLTFTPDDTDFDPSSESGEGDIDNGFAVGAAAGVVLGGGLRLEGEALFSSNDLGGIEELDVDNVELNHMAAFANLIYDFQVGGVTPYVGAGIGYGSTTFDVDGESIHDEDTAWQIKAGASFPVNDTLTIDVGYRYISMAAWEESFDDVDIDDSPDAGPGTLGFEFEPTAHALTVGARFKLGAGA